MSSTITQTNSTENIDQHSEVEQSARAQVTAKRVPTLRRAAVVIVAALLTTLGMAAASPGIASASASLDTHTPFRVDNNCTYHTDLPNNGSGAFYTQLWSYDASHGGWSSGPWVYTSVAAGNWAYENDLSGWARSDGTLKAPPSDSTVYLYAFTYTPQQGYVGHQLDRCYQNRTYLGW